MTQSIIVYRNPVEQAFWEGAMSGEAFPFMVALAVFFIVTVIMASQVDKLRWKFRRVTQGWWNFFIFGPAALAAFLTIKFMAI